MNRLLLYMHACMLQQCVITFVLFSNKVDVLGGLEERCH